MFELNRTLRNLAIIPHTVVTSDSKVRDVIDLMEEYRVNLFPILNQEGRVLSCVLRKDLLGQVTKDPSLELSSVGLCASKQPGNYLISYDYDFDKLAKPKSDLILTDEYKRFFGILTYDLLIDTMFNYYKLRLKEKESIFNSALNGIVIVNKEGLIKEMNPAAERITGLIGEKTIGRRPEQRGMPSNYINVLKAGEKSLATRLIHNNRSYIVSRSPIVIDNQISGAVSIFQEVTELERTASKLNAVQQLNNELEAVISSSFDGIVVADAKGEILKLNKSAAKLLDIPIAQNNERAKLPDWILQFILNAKTKFDAITYTTTNHLGNELIITASPISEDSNATAEKFVLNIRDISELSMLKNELKSSKELSKKYLQELDNLKNVKTFGIIARSKQMGRVIDVALRMAEVDTTTLILGETGSGKQLIAKLIHENSNRCKGPFVDINCGAIPENLLESELFGYEPGTFTGGLKSGKIGLFELANGGTIFLDEIGDLPFSLQVKLLKVLQNQEVLRLGGLKPRKINARVIAATNKNLEDMVKKGTFREDLYYRLNIVPILIPPLRERKEDILPLLNHYIEVLAQKYSRKVEFTTEVYEFFLKYHWPGNVRELQNKVERLFVTANSSLVAADNVVPIFAKGDNTESLVKNILSDSGDVIPLKEAIELLENTLIDMALKKCGSTHKAAKALGVNQSTVSRKINRIRPKN